MIHATQVSLSDSGALYLYAIKYYRNVRVYQIVNYEWLEPVLWYVGSLTQRLDASKKYIKRLLCY